MKTRSFLITTAIASIAALTLAGCTSGASEGGDASSSKDLTVFISADTNVQDLWEQNLIPAFVAANPGYTVATTVDTHGLHDQQTVAKLTAATVQGSDPGFDIVDAGFVDQVGASGLLTLVSSENIPALADVPEATVKAGGDGSIPYRASSVLLAYNTDTVQSPPQTLDELLSWIKANPGKFTYNSPESGGSGQAFVTTILDANIDPADRTKMVVDYVPELQTEWEAGFETMASLNKSMYQQGVYPNGNNQVLDLLASGEIDMAPVWSDQFISGQKNGQIPANIAYTQISDPSLTGGAAYLGIPTASPRQEGALKLADWLLSPEAQTLISDGMAGYPVINLENLSADLQEKFKDADIGNLRQPYFALMRADMNKQWAEKVPGN